MNQATYEDVNLILRLYEIRREEKLRAARLWYVTNFKPKTLADMNALCGPGTEANPLFRQALSYWDMVASFITAGVLNEELFFQSNRELLFFWIRLKPVIEEVRTVFGPKAYKNLETVAESYAKYLGPETYEGFAARVLA
jgi:hypothetical protein